MSVVRRTWISSVVCAVVAVAVGFGCKGGSGGGGADASGSKRDPSSSRRVADSPMHAAAERNDDATIQSLLSQGTSANVTLKNGMTPLHVASRGGQARAATALLNGGADPAAVDDNGETPLMMASMRGYEGMVRDMLAKHPEVNAQRRKTNTTALMYAVDRSGNANIVRMLVAAGADKSLRDSKGRTAEDMAMVKNNQAIIDALNGRMGAPTMNNMAPMNNGSMNRAPMNQPPPQNPPQQNPMGNMGAGTTSTGNR